MGLSAEPEPATGSVVTPCWCPDRYGRVRFASGAALYDGVALEQAVFTDLSGEEAAPRAWGCFEGQVRFDEDAFEPLRQEDAAAWDDDFRRPVL